MQSNKYPTSTPMDEPKIYQPIPSKKKSFLLSFERFISEQTVAFFSKEFEASMLVFVILLSYNPFTDKLTFVCSINNIIIGNHICTFLTHFKYLSVLLLFYFYFFYIFHVFGPPYIKTFFLHLKCNFCAFNIFFKVPNVQP